jgi:hypothetical protein
VSPLIRTKIIECPTGPPLPYHGLSRGTRRVLIQEEEDALRRTAHVARDRCVAGAIMEASAYLARLGLAVVEDVSARECLAAAKTPHAAHRYVAVAENLSAVAAQTVLVPATCRRP